MKRLALVLMFAVASAFAAQQDPASAPAKDPANAPADTQKPAEDAQKPDAKQAEPAPAPASDNAAPAAADSATTKKEQTLEGVIDVGERWVSNVGGDMNTYRSIVNLGSGPRVVNVDLKLIPPDTTNKVADSILLQAHSWGDPYNSMRLDMQKNRVYRFTSNYSNISYFNYLPSYADPTLATTGVFMNQQAYDTKTRNFDNELLLLPGYWIQPYLAYSRNTDGGTGISTLVDGSNNTYPIVNNIHWGQNIFRGGVRVQLKQLHLTFEQGSIAFKDDQGAYSNGPGTGDRTTPYLGQLLDLTNGWQAYYIRGDGNFTKGYGTYSPASWVDISGQIYHSDPHISFHAEPTVSSNIPAATPNITFYSSAFDQIYGSAAMPRTSGSLSGELRFLNRIRIRESYESDSYHDNSSSTLGQLFSLSSGLTANLNSASTGYLQVEQHRSQTEALIDITRKLMVRGGYRYEWGSAAGAFRLVSTTTPDESGEIGSSRRPGRRAIQAHPAHRRQRRFRSVRRREDFLPHRPAGLLEIPRSIALHPAEESVSQRGRELPA